MSDLNKMKVMLDPGAYLPQRAHEKDAGYDLFSPKRFVLGPHEVRAIDTGVHIQLPDGKCGIVFSKSGLLKDHAVLSMGLIDEPYRGAIGAILVNLSGQHLTFAKGEKISQFFITNYYAYDLEVVNALNETDRGSGGFGSTGRMCDEQV